MREFALDPVWQDDIDEALGRIGRSKELRQITAGCCDGSDRRGSLRRRLLPRFSPLSQLFSQTGMPLLLFGRRELHRQIVKTINVPFCVALNETDELLGGSQGRTALSE